MSSLRDLIVRRLLDRGVRAIFGVPGGGGNLDLIDAAGRAGLPFVLTATETGGALAAIGQAEVTGTPGACLTTLGPGAASVTNGVACAYLDRAPLFVFTDSHAAAAAGTYEHQQIDQLALMRPVARWSGRLLPGRAEATIEQAFAASLALPPGPVHVDCPEDFEATETTAAGSARDEPPPQSDRTASDRDHENRAFEDAVSAARRPVFIVGLGARTRMDAGAIRGFIERRGVPALVTYKGKGIVADDHPCFAGVFTNALIEKDVVASSDVIVGLGLDPVELLPRPWPYAQPVVSICPWRVDDRQVPFAAQQVTTVPDGLAALDALLPRAEWDLEAVRRQVANQRRAVDIGDGFTAQRVVQASAEHWAPSHRVTVDAGAHMLPATMLWPVGEPGQLLISNGLSTMGFALPAAIGAAFADRGRPVVALTGDGGLLMCAAELLTAAREKLRVVVVVFNDASLSLIEIKQQRRGYAPAGVDLGVVKWCTLAESFGVPAFAADNEPALVRAIEEATSIDGPALIDARIDRSNYSRTLAAVRG
jgi:acetolactate synthase-1/2/3 large subunit